MINTERKSNRIRSALFFSLSVLVFLLAAVGVSLLLSRSGIYPAGSDTLYHLHRGEIVYRGIAAGNWWPNYDASWFNGVEILRYQAPLSAYLLALCNAICGGRVIGGYLLFSGVLCFLSAFPWCFIGLRLKRPLMGLILGLLWFFMPHNLYVLFVDGDLAKVTALIFLPAIFFLCIRCQEEKRWQDAVWITVLFALLLLSDVTYGILTAISMVFLSLFTAMVRKSMQGVGKVLLSVVFAFLILGIYLLPYFVKASPESAGLEILPITFQPLWKSLNPFARLQLNTVEYFSLPAFLLAVLGLLFGKKPGKGALVNGLLIMLLTSSLIAPLFARLSASPYLSMMLYVSMGLACILVGLAEWKTLKKPILVIVCLLLAIDTIPSLSLIYGEQNEAKPEERFENIADFSLLSKAKKITTQRLALLTGDDGSPVDPYLITNFGSPVNTSAGSAPEAAATAHNILQLNRAVKGGQYAYLFDRCIELGNDTVLVYTEAVADLTEYPVAKMDAVAEAAGYQFVDANASYRLYHLDTYQNWGVTSKFRAIAIGKETFRVPLDFPAFEEGESNVLDDYTFEELSKYDVIFLNGFTCNVQEDAENLVLRLSEAGVRVVICADGIPENHLTHDQRFLDVVCNPIHFSNGYPELDTEDGRFFPALFPREYREMDTVFVNGLDEIRGRVFDNEVYLPFYGTVKNENIVVIGLNLSFYLSLTGDPDVEYLLSRAMDISPNDLPDRKIVKLDLRYEKNGFSVTSPKDDVNTALAYHPDFATDGPVDSRDNLLYVKKGTTHVSLQYPYPLWGGLISAAGLFLCILQAVLGRKQAKKDTASEEPSLHKNDTLAEKMS